MLQRNSHSQSNVRAPEFRFKLQSVSYRKGTALFAMR
jgi:hypothetical protein